MALKKMVPDTDANGNPIPGKYVVADATIIDAINPLIPPGDEQTSIVRAASWFLLFRILS